MRIRCPHCKVRIKVPPERPRNASVLATCPGCQRPFSLGEATAAALGEIIVEASPPQSGVSPRTKGWRPVVLLLCLLLLVPCLIVLALTLLYPSQASAPDPDEFQKGKLRDGDLFLRIVETDFRRVEIRPLFADPHLTSDPCVCFLIEAVNCSETRLLRYSGFGSSWDHELFSRPSLTDEFGNSYPFVDRCLERPRGQDDLMRPGERLRALLVFEHPIRKATSLTLHLPKPGRSSLQRDTYRFKLLVSELKGS